jgi:hypothetical protein
MALSIQDCADSIVTRLFTVNYGRGREQVGDRIAIKQKCDAGEADLGGRNFDCAVQEVEEELRAWLQSMDDCEP